LASASYTLAISNS